MHVHSDGKISNWDKLQAALDRGPESTTVQSRVQDDVTEAVNEQNVKLCGEHVHTGTYRNVLMSDISVTRFSF